MNNDQSSLKLANLLDRIDHKRGSGGIVPQKDERKSFNSWVEYVDPATEKPYYFNIKSKATQWEKPAEFELDAAEASHQSTDQSGGVSSTQLVDMADIPYGWVEHFDPVSRLPYYYNMILKTTQWAKPKGFEASTTSLAVESTTEYSEKAFFCKESGRFSGTSSYWQKVSFIVRQCSDIIFLLIVQITSLDATDRCQMGRPEDKAGRQLGVFMDLSTLEENREQARLMKEEARKNSGSRGDLKWSDYKEEKKAAKKRKASAWVYDP